MNNQNFSGVDACLKTSLLEYEFIARPHTDDYEDEYFVVYKRRGNNFCTGFVRESELNKLIEGKEWASDSNIEDFLYCLDRSKEEWLALPFVNKLSDVLGQWCVENIFGFDYFKGMTEAEVEAKYLTLDLF